MLEELKIKNFKSHKDTTLKFSEGLTLLVGKSQSGKSAALQALLMLVENKGWKAKMLYGQKKKGVVEIKMLFDDWYSVSMKKKMKSTNTETSYKVSFDGGEIFKARKVGRTVPEEVSNIINLGTPNIQKQDDFSFLVDSTKGEVSKEVGNFIGINSVQLALREVTSELSEVRAAMKIAKEEEKEAEEELKRYKKLKGVKMLYVSYEKAKGDIEKIEDEMHKLEDYISEMPIVKKQVRAIENTLFAIDHLLLKLSKTYQEENKLRERLEEYQRFIEVDVMWRKANQRFERVKEKILKMKKCPLCLTRLTKEQIQEFLK